MIAEEIITELEINDNSYRKKPVRYFCIKYKLTFDEVLDYYEQMLERQKQRKNNLIETESEG